MDLHPNKLTIFAYAENDLKKYVDVFVVPINPEQYSQTFRVQNDVKPPLGAQGAEAHFQSSPPGELRLDFVFDGTGTVYGYAQPGRSVPEQINAFKRVVYTLQGEIHEPRYLKLVWKDFVFDSKLSDLRVNFTLFDSAGTPLRAKLSCTFVEFKETERRVSEEAKASPDLTQTRIVKDAENLSLLTHSVYGAPDFYLEVARSNELTNFRRLRAGTALVFPPLAKPGS